MLTQSLKRWIKRCLTPSNLWIKLLEYTTLFLLEICTVHIYKTIHFVLISFNYIPPISCFVLWIIQKSCLWLATIWVYRFHRTLLIETFKFQNFWNLWIISESCSVQTGRFLATWRAMDDSNISNEYRAVYRSVFIGDDTLRQGRFVLLHRPSFSGRNSCVPAKQTYYCLLILEICVLERNLRSVS